MSTPGVRGLAGRWERAICRYLSAHRVPLTWGGPVKGFTGIAGYGFRRIVPKSADGLETWRRMPEYMRKHRDTSNLIVFVTNPIYGENIDDSLVVMRLSTFAEIFGSHVNTDRERYIYAPAHHG